MSLRPTWKVHAMQAGDEFVTELDVSELAPVEMGFEDEPDGDAEFGGLASAETQWSQAGGAPAGQLGKALQGVSVAAAEGQVVGGSHASDEL